MKSNNHQPKWDRVRLSPRIHTVKEISVHYEGHTEEVAFRPPDVSTHGMFFNTPTRFPEGAVLNLRFRLALTGAEVRTRCEVRYCLPGVGVGVEFIDISPEAVRKIEREVQLCKRARLRKKTVKLA
jgi:PilZ domain-containing protein